MDEKTKIVQQYIKDKQMSVSEFARKINMPYSTLTSILKNGLESGTLANVIKICEGIGLTFDQLRELAGETSTEIKRQISPELETMLTGVNFDSDIMEIVVLLQRASRQDFKFIYDLIHRLDQR